MLSAAGGVGRGRGCVFIVLCCAVLLMRAAAGRWFGAGTACRASKGAELCWFPGGTQILVGICSQ